MGAAVKRGRHTSIAELRRLWGSSLTSTEIGQKLGISGGAVSARAKRRGIAPRTNNGPKPKIKDDDLFTDMHGAGVTFKYMALHFNCHPSTILNRAKKLGLQPRGQSGHNSITIEEYNQMRLVRMMGQTAQRENAAFKRVYFAGGNEHAKA